MQICFKKRVCWAKDVARWGKGEAVWPDFVSTACLSCSVCGMTSTLLSFVFAIPRNSSSHFSLPCSPLCCSVGSCLVAWRGKDMRDLEIEEQDACVYLGVGLCQLNMCSGRIMMPRGGAPETRAGSTSKKASRAQHLFVFWFSLRRRFFSKEESSLMRTLLEEAVGDDSINPLANSRGL